MSGGGGGGSGSTISTSEPRLGAMRIQQSSYGLSLPIVYGRTRVAGNLIWYGDFVAIAHTTTTTSGGGGGGGKGGGGGGGGGAVTQQSTTYTYEAALMMALCEGPIGGVVSIWQGKKRFETRVVPQSVRQEPNPYWQPYEALPDYDPREKIDIVVPAYSQTAIQQLGLSLAIGSAGQPTWSHLSTNHPAQALGYSSTAHLHSAAFSLGSNAEIDNHSFELDAKLQFGGGIVDASPKDIVYDLLTNPQYGAAFPVASMGDMSVYGDYCQAMGLFLSPAFTEQQEAREHLKLLTSMTNSACVWSEGKLKLVPYGDEAVSGNGATYTPNLTPIYDLTDDDYIVTGAEDPVKCDRKTPADAFNQVQVEYLNRANAYNIEIAEAKDQANIEKFGLRPRDPIKMHAICDATVARRAAQLQLQRALYVRNEYEFRLGWKYCLLEPMDLVTLTDAGLGLDRTPVRIIDVQEDSEGLLTLRAEDYPFGVASATLYPTQSGAGFSADYNAAPGNVADPVFFEPPIELATATGLEVWCAVSGLAGSAGSLWGGCNVWASLDGSTYKQVGTVYGGSRYGQLTAALDAAPGGTAAVHLSGRGGQMLSGTQQEAQLLSTLCWVGGDTGGELFAYETASLTGSNAYNLTGLVRGAYQSKTAAKQAGANFVRIDQAIAKSDPLDVSMIGKTIFFKFASFNVYGGGLQTLPEVSAFQYAITGDMFKLPPPDVKNFTLNGDVMSWTGVSVSDLVGGGYKIRYQYGQSTWWPTAVALHEGVITESPYTLVNRPSGLVTLLIKAVDSTGNESANPASITLNLGDALVENIINSWPQHTTWTGTKTNCTVISGELVASAVDQFYGSDDEPFFGADTGLFFATSQSAPMAYEFAVLTDGSGRLTLSHSIVASGFTIEYQRDNTDAFFGPDGEYFYGPDDEPFLGEPLPWTTWPGFIDVANAVEIRFRVTTSGGSGVEKIETLQANLDVPDVIVQINDQVVSASGTRLAMPAGLTAIRNIQITVQSDGHGGVTAIYADKSNTTLGPLVTVLNASGASVEGLIDAVVQAY